MLPTNLAKPAFGAVSFDSVAHFFACHKGNFRFVFKRGGIQNPKEAIFNGFGRLKQVVEMAFFANYTANL